MSEQIAKVGVSRALAQWTQDEAIAYESACECITDLHGIIMSAVYKEEAETAPDEQRLAKLKMVAVKLWQKRARLHVHSHTEIACIRNEYGAKILGWREAVKAGNVTEIDVANLPISI